jgi:hypothetical protein
MRVLSFRVAHCTGSTAILTPMALDASIARGEVDVGYRIVAADLPPGEA